MWQEGYDMTEWFSVELLEMIFDLLDVPELLKCSLVNKKWRATVAPVFWKHKKCFAYIEEPCSELLELNDTLRKTNSQMINGIHIRVGLDENSKYWKTSKLKKLLSVLINWPFQYIDVELDYYNDDEVACDVAMKLSKEIFWASRTTVRELSVGFKNETTDFFHDDTRRKRKRIKDDGISNIFPNLRSIEFYGEHFPSDFYNFVHFSAPSLVEVKGQLVELGLVKSWDESIMRVLKSISITPEGTQRQDHDCVNYETLKRFAGFQTSLHHLRMNDTDYRGKVAFPQSWLNPFAQIFRNSWNALKRVDFCASELIKIMQLERTDNDIECGTLMFPTVTKLVLDMPDGTSARVERSILRRIKIGICFPKLTELSVSFGECCHALEDEEYEEDYEECPASDLSLELEITFIWPYRETLEYFFNTLPLLTSLILDINDFFEDREHAYSLSAIFSSFQLLKELRLTLGFTHEDDTIGCFSLDAIFCGINFEEAEKIKSDCRKNGLELKKVNIVPLRPGITAAANLKNMHVFTNSRRRLSKAKAWLSKVSEVLAFDRMPKMRVSSQWLI